MIEREFVKQKKKEFQIEEFVAKSLRNVGHSHTKMQRTPLGEKIIIHAAKLGLVVGREGSNIKKLTAALKRKFKLENPQIEIMEVENISLNATVVAEKIASSIERFGSGNFKGTGHRAMGEVMGAGALGIEITISGKIPSSRAKTWRCYDGYLKKCGDIAVSGVDTAYASAFLKTGVIGIQVRIMPPDTILPDRIVRREIVTEKKPEQQKGEKKEKREEKSGAVDGRKRKRERKIKGIKGKMEKELNVCYC
ncbi:30S ribosomal protein S3 [archaeon]|nr:30S ribosomal protein S3 [archaeon]